MAKCLRCGAGNEWIQGKVAAEESMCDLPPVDPAPIPMVLRCPSCGVQHLDVPDLERGWSNPPHKSHLCLACGVIWRPADVPTTGVPSVGRGSKDTWPPT